MAEDVITERGVISPELAAKYYPQREYSEVKQAAQAQIRAEAVRKAQSRGATIRTYTTSSGELVAAPASMNLEGLEARRAGVVQDKQMALEKTQQEAQLKEEGKILVEPREAYEAGLISRAAKEKAEAEGTKVITTTEDIARAKEYSAALRRDYPDTTVMDRQAAADRYYRMEKQKSEAVAEVAANPWTRVAYVFDQDILGMGTVAEYGVTTITGGDWQEKSDQMIYSYASELVSRPETKDIQIYGGALTGERYVNVTVPSYLYYGGAAAAKTGVVAGAMAFTGGVAGKPVAVAASTGMRAVYGASLGMQYGTTIKDTTAENIARSFIYTVPLAMGVVAKGVRMARKPPYTLEVSATKDTSRVVSQKGKMQVEVGDSKTRFNLLEKGFRAKLGLTKPKVVGRVKGIGTTVTVSSDIGSIGKGRFLYEGTVRGKKVMLVGKETQMSAYDVKPDRITGTTGTRSGTDFYVGKKAGWGRAATESKFDSVKILESQKGDIWLTKSDIKRGVGEVNIVTRKAGGGFKKPDIQTKVEGAQGKSFGITDVSKGGPASSGTRYSYGNMGLKHKPQAPPDVQKMEMGASTLEKVTTFAATKPTPTTSSPRAVISSTDTTPSAKVDTIQAPMFAELDTEARERVGTEERVAVASATDILQRERTRQDVLTQQRAAVKADTMPAAAIDFADICTRGAERIMPVQVEAMPQMQAQQTRQQQRSSYLSMLQLESPMMPQPPRPLRPYVPPPPPPPDFPLLFGDADTKKQRGTMGEYVRVWPVATSAAEIKLRGLL